MNGTVVGVVVGVGDGNRTPIGTGRSGQDSTGEAEVGGGRNAGGVLTLLEKSI